MASYRRYWTPPNVPWGAETTVDAMMWPSAWTRDARPTVAMVTGAHVDGRRIGDGMRILQSGKRGRVGDLHGAGLQPSSDEPLCHVQGIPREDPAAGDASNTGGCRLRRGGEPPYLRRMAASLSRHAAAVG